MTLPSSLVWPIPLTLIGFACGEVESDPVGPSGVSAAANTRPAPSMEAGPTARLPPAPSRRMSWGPPAGMDLDELVEAMAAGNTCVNIHTSAKASGTIRSQTEVAGPPGSEAFIGAAWR